MKIRNINRFGQEFVPAEYTVLRAEHPEIYQYLEDMSWKTKRDCIMTSPGTVTTTAGTA